ncbi:saccharopine dehydrogenase NADP-binding domain-containing protein [candidate division KSB1 bacterium]
MRRGGSEEIRILIIGGYGRTGIQVARLLLEETDAEVRLGGRHLCRAEEAATKLAGEFGEARVSWTAVDVAASESLRSAVKACDLVIICAQMRQSRVEAATTLLAAGIDCIEINAGSYEDWESVGAYQKCRDTDRMVIAEAGILPGLPSLLVNQASGRFDRLNSAVIGHLMRLESWETLEIENFLADLEFKSRLYSEGSWKEVSWRKFRPIDFGPPYGVCASYPYILPEILELPDGHGLKSLGLYAADLGHWTLGWLLFIYTIAAGGKSRFVRKLIGGLMHKCYGWFSKPPFGMRIKFEAEGEMGGQAWRLETTIEQADVYKFTAIAVTALVIQWLDGSIRRPGLYMMGNVADPERFLADMDRLGASVTSKLAPVQKE